MENEKNMYFFFDVWLKLVIIRVFDMVIIYFFYLYFMYFGGNDRSCRKKSIGFLILIYGKKLVLRWDLMKVSVWLINCILCLYMFKEIKYKDLFKIV